MNKNIGFILLAGLSTMSLNLYAGEPLPYGHKDFVPTPERPIYFRAGNGEYPGATPPLEWWDGTPVLRDAKGQDRFNKNKVNTVKLWDFADTKSRNILWKVPVPGWSLSHPIVVGKKVFAVGEPDFVTCWDLDTGRQLWQRRIMPLLLDGMPEKKAVAGQKVLDLARALFIASSPWPQTGGHTPFDGLPNSGAPEKPGEFVAAKRDIAHRLAKSASTHRPDGEAFGDAELLKALDADIAILNAVAQAADLSALDPLIGKKGKRSLNLVNVLGRKLGVPVGGVWWGYVGTADSALASDGERIYGVFTQVQVFCYDLDGKLLWGHREKGERNTFHNPPLLCGDLLIVKGNAAKTVRGLDKRTGQVKWEYPWKHNNFMALRQLRLTAPDGSPVDVIVTPEHHKIIRVRDGKELGEFRSERNAPHYHILGFGDTIAVGGKSTSGPTEPSAFYRLKMTGPDTATGTLLYECEKDILKSMGLPTATDTHFFTMNGGVYDRANGAKVGKMPFRELGSGTAIAGKYLITQETSDRDGSGPWGRKRDDRKTFCGFSVVDISDPKNPRLVNKTRNLLGYKDPPADIIINNYLLEFGPYDFCGCYSGSASYFGTDMTGVVPHGNRLLIQSSAYLYCIGGKP